MHVLTLHIVTSVQCIAQPFTWNQNWTLRVLFSALCPSPILININGSDASHRECIPKGSENQKKIRSFDVCQACLTGSNTVFHLQVFLVFYTFIQTFAYTDLRKLQMGTPNGTQVNGKISLKLNLSVFPVFYFTLQVMLNIPIQLLY